jgi:hypothetical protein
VKPYRGLVLVGRISRHRRPLFSIVPERTSSRRDVTQPSLARHRGPLTQDVEETMAPVTRELVFA